MYIEFKNTKIKKICEDFEKASIKYGDICAKKIFQRINEIKASSNLKELKLLPAPKCHKLGFNRQGQWSVHLENPMRLVFELLIDGECVKPKADLKFEEINGVRILEVCDYH